MVIIETQNSRPNNIQKTSAQSYKTQIKILLFPGLALSDSEQPGPGATLLGWPKSIYYITTQVKTVDESILDILFHARQSDLSCILR